MTLGKIWKILKLTVTRISHKNTIRTWNKPPSQGPTLNTPQTKIAKQNIPK